MIDARTQHRPDPRYAARLIAKAQRLIGSRNKLAVRMGVSRRRLGYIESGKRTLPDGRLVPVRMSFAEQVLLEDIIQ